MAVRNASRRGSDTLAAAASSGYSAVASFASSSSCRTLRSTFMRGATRPLFTPARKFAMRWSM
jgi:hypothetical protein